MSDLFNIYSRYYDLLYKDKDYAAEASYINDLIRKYRPGARSILDLGCGTGKHDACFSEMGYSVCGVDLSDTMLLEAHKRSVPGKLEFHKRDVRAADLGRQFDVVISLFHVMSYQATDDDVTCAFRTAARHLVPGGIFIFDFWNGPGVLNDPPVVRIKRLENEMVRVVRIAEPEMREAGNVVDVRYQIMALDKRTGVWSEFREIHPMRYFFLKELEKFLLGTGFSIKSDHEWMTGKCLATAWNGLIIAEKQER
jgi:SAM-dependent methyltransferase